MKNPYNIGVFKQKAGNADHPQPHQMKTEKTHDFTSSKLRWGWNILRAYPQPSGELIILAVGKGVKRGDSILLDSNAGTKTLEVKSVEYKDNPRDLFNATLTTQPQGNQ